MTQYNRVITNGLSGLRCIGVGVKTDNGFVFYGVIGFQDTIIPDASALIRQLSMLSIRPVMLYWGDGEGTAVSIANSLNWPSPSDVHYRQSPQDKLAFMEHCQRTCSCCAMVGDGVNDGAAVRKAQVGIAMGGSNSTDVARQAADIVLADDRLEGIVETVLEGRAICINVQRFLGFQLSCSMASLLLVGCSGAMYSGSRLSPLHLLLLNIVMDGPPAQSLAMSHVPHVELVSVPNIRLLDASMAWSCLTRACLMSLLCIVYSGGHHERTLLPPLLVLSLSNAYSWSADLSNRYLACCLAVVLLLLAVCNAVPGFNRVVGVGRMGGWEWMLLAMMACVFLISVKGARMLSSLSGRVRGYQKL